MSSGRGLEERIRHLKLRAAALRRNDREDDAEEVEDDIRFLETLPEDGFVAEVAEAALELEENLNEQGGG